MTPEKQALCLIQRIFEAALDQSKWPAFVDEFSAAYGGAAVGFALQLPGQPQSVGGVYATGFVIDDPKLRAVFIEHTQRGLPWEDIPSQHRQHVARVDQNAAVVFGLHE